MRTLILALAVILLAAPAWATVEITLTDLGEGVVQIGYDASTETELVRAFALNIAATDGNIIDINDYAIGDDNSGYGIFPGTFGYISVDPTTGGVDSWDVAGYSPVAPVGDPDAEGEIPGPAITIEMGSLYDANNPGETGVLCTITVDEDVTKVCVTGNAIRGNVVLEDAGSVIPAEACLNMVSDCFPSSFSTYADWVTYGKPKCWCNSAADPTATGDYQCDGDLDGAAFGPYQIYTPDLTILANNWRFRGMEPTYDPCADIDHKAFGPYRIYTPDLTILATNWRMRASQLPGNCGTAARPE